jgi:hypothetical protein
MFDRSTLTERRSPKVTGLVACFVAGSIAGLLLAGCATTETQTEPLLPRRFVSTVSSSTGLFTPARNTPIAWSGTLEVNDSTHQLSAERIALITGIVRDELTKRGYSFSASTENARYSMQAVLLVGKDAEGEQLNALSGVAPELQQGDGSQSGALGIYFKDTDTQQIVWKSATELVTHSQLPLQQQDDRIRYAVQQMMSGLPLAQ